MKRVLAFILSIVIFVSVFAVVVQAISVYNNHTMVTNTNFAITDDGVASVYTSYDAYEDVMTGATITITIKKRSFLFFWNEVTTHTLYSTKTSYSNLFEYQLSGGGTYKCEVEYVISGTAGEADVIPFEDTLTY